MSTRRSTWWSRWVAPCIAGFVGGIITAIVIAFPLAMVVGNGGEGTPDPERDGWALLIVMVAVPAVVGGFLSAWLYRRRRTGTTTSDHGQVGPLAAAPGWYDSTPGDPATRRYWDGVAVDRLGPHTRWASRRRRTWTTGHVGGLGSGPGMECGAG